MPYLILLLIIFNFQIEVNATGVSVNPRQTRNELTSNFVQNLIGEVFSLECFNFFQCPHQISFQMGVLSKIPVIDLYLVMGQSNAVGVGSEGALMGSDPDDATIRLSYEIGVPGTAKCTAKSDGIVSMIVQKQPLSCLDSKGKIGYIFPTGFGFGPEAGLARKLKKEMVNNFGIFKFAWGATSLAEDWKPFGKNGAQLFSKFVHALNGVAKSYSQKNYRVRVVGLFWMQGESDSLSLNAATDYAKNFSNFIWNVKMIVGNSKLPVVVGLIAPYRPSINSWKYAEQVRQTQMNSATKWVETADLPMSADGVHYNSEGLLLLGTRFADAYLSIIK